jgi:hypothetical protein
LFTSEAFQHPFGRGQYATRRRFRFAQASLAGGFSTMTVPLDFADTKLAHLLFRESLSLILTIDHDDLETYRIGGRKRFSILPRRPQ